MKLLIKSFILFTVLFLVNNSLIAQAVFLDSNSTSCNFETMTIVPESEVTFYFRWVNNLDTSIGSILNIFEISSPDNLDLSNMESEILDISFPEYFELNFSIIKDSISDSFYRIGLSGNSNNIGLPKDYNDIAFSITIGPFSKLDAGKSIIIENGFWLWKLINSSNSFQPDWNGPFQFVISECVDSIDTDGDYDGIMDGCDPCLNDTLNDFDNDDICGMEDNCPYLYNPLQLDSNDDGIGDLCDNPRLVYIDSVFGLGSHRRTIETGKEVAFVFKVVNESEYFYYGITNGFKVYSPDGAQWGKIIGETVQPLSFWYSLFDLVYSIGFNYNDGITPDTISYGGASLFGSGLPPNFNQQSYIIKIGPIHPNQTGKTICIDSTFYTPTGLWHWTNSSGGYIPQWGGPYCYTIENITRTWHVSLDGNGDFTTIQSALNAANHFDTVLVAPGTYTGPLNTELDFNNKKLYLISEEGPESTIIDCQDTYQGFVFTALAESLVVVEGFTITNGYNSGGGGGIKIINSSPIFKNCIISDCHSGVYHGGGIQIQGELSAPLFQNCTIKNNTANTSGAGAFIGGQATPIFESCLFVNNESYEGSAATVIQASPTFRNCTMVNNQSTYTTIYVLATSYPVFENNIIAYNTGYPIVLSAGPNNWPNYPLFQCNNFYGNSRGDWGYELAPYFGVDGNISENPYFCDTTNNLFTLGSISSCLPENNSCNQLIGAFGQGCEIYLNRIFPNPVHLLKAFNINNELINLISSDLPEGYSSAEINTGSILINGTLSPDSVNLFSTHPAVAGEGLLLKISANHFILSYGFLYDVTEQEYTISGEMNDGTPFEIMSDFTFVGHRSGDVNLDGTVDISDLVYAVGIFFDGATPPARDEAIDIDRNGIIDIGDIVKLVDYMF
ncbi:MAG: hypothetical protein DWP97_06985 [Calditrichaeota bacterium]|nr:MAG: hypothetical protein DWP97_06985 [Calditrichota bacterium]